jgi:hypothetical protein
LEYVLLLMWVGLSTWRKTSSQARGDTMGYQWLSLAEDNAPEEWCSHAHHQQRQPLMPRKVEREEWRSSSWAQPSGKLRNCKSKSWEVVFSRSRQVGAPGESKHELILYGKTGGDRTI